MRESKVEAHFAKEVERIGGLCRKMKWIGRAHAPDRFAAFPWTTPWFVELKRPGKCARPGQEREHQRMRAHGVKVIVISSLEEVDRFIKHMEQLKND